MRRHGSGRIPNIDRNDDQIESAINDTNPVDGTVSVARAAPENFGGPATRYRSAANAVRRQGSVDVGG